jgi:hypothetical protein
MPLPIIVASLSFIATVVSLWRFIPRWRESNRYEVEYRNECEHVSDMPHIEPPWYRPPDNKLPSAKAWLIINVLIFLASCLWAFSG